MHRRNIQVFMFLVFAVVVTTAHTKALPECLTITLPGNKTCAFAKASDCEFDERTRSCKEPGQSVKVFAGYFQCQDTKIGQPIYGLKCVMAVAPNGQLVMALCSEKRECIEK